MIIMMIFDSPVQRKTHTTLKVHDANYIFSQKIFLSSLNTRCLPCKPFYLVKTARAESKFQHPKVATLRKKQQEKAAKFGINEGVTFGFALRIKLQFFLQKTQKAEIFAEDRENNHTGSENTPSKQDKALFNY